MNYDFQLFNGIGNGSPKTIPVQTLPNKKKTLKWKKACMDALERTGIEQLHKNIIFREARKMIECEFTYQAVDLDSPMNLPWFDKEIRKLRTDKNIPTYLKHFDFIGIIVNAIVGIYAKMDDRYRVESQDEYSTNEWIRTKTESLHKQAQAIFEFEVNSMLIKNGLDPYREQFESEEEKQAYQEQLAQRVKTYTPEQIQKNLSKNFKVIATEWAQNTLTADFKRFNLADMDSENLVDYILTGRFFRHYRVGYDKYEIESWTPEETFFDQSVISKYPQDGEYIGRITSMNSSQVLSTFGHLMNQKQIELIGNYWNQDTKYGGEIETSGTRFLDNIFPKQTIVPFHNYYDHQINLQMESALGVPMGEKLVQAPDGTLKKQDVWLPREENDYQGTFNSGIYSRYLRDDIDVRTDTIRVTEAYWKSWKRIGIVVYENSLGALAIEETTDDLLPEFLEDNEIKKTNESVQALADALKEYQNGNGLPLEEFIGTVTYHYIPEVWQGVKIKGNASTIKDDIYLDVRPLEYQIKGDSEYYDVRLPVSGIITNGLAKKIIPYQQLHNIAMNQITELLEKELGVFFSFDINALPSEYQDESTEESIFRLRDIIKDSALMPIDPSKQNTQNNVSNPNIFQRQEVVYATQVQYRWELAQQYKREAFAQIGITDQILGAPTTYETAEGVKQGAQATYALLTRNIDQFNTAKNKGMEVHLAVAQFCEVNGKSSSTIIRKGDGEIAYLNILKEDPEVFALRKLSIMPITSNKDAKIAETIKTIIMNDNTFEKDLGDMIDIMTTPVIVELQQIAYDQRARKQKSLEEQRAFESQENDKLIQASKEEAQLKHDREVELAHIAGEYKLEDSYLGALGRASDKDASELSYDRIDKGIQNSINNEFKNRELNTKETLLDAKIQAEKENRAIKLRQLADKAEDRRLKEKQINAQVQTSLINKN
jgi:hypothetical protein